MKNHLRDVFRFGVISGVILYIFFIIFIKDSGCKASTSLNLWTFFPLKLAQTSPNTSSISLPPQKTNLSHLYFGLLGSEEAWHYRKAYIESWWRPSAIKGYLYLDEQPKGHDILPWSKNSPPYRVSENLTNFLQETGATAPVMIRMVHGIMEAFRQAETEKGLDLRWLVMGDDDSIFFVDNIVELLASVDHNKYYYFGGQSEYILSNFWFSFNQGFGGAGFMLSYPLAKALANDMENCLRRYAHVKSADTITMACIADIGVNVSPHKGFHQIDLRGDISGLLSAHPKSPLISLHHFDAIDPIFPSKDRFESTRHLMKATSFGQSRMLQQTICYERRNNWSVSISWGYSVHIYEQIMSRRVLQTPIETFTTWVGNPNPPRYMFNTRRSTNDSCETPHVFYFDSIKKLKMEHGDYVIETLYSRASERGLPACGNHSAHYISKFKLISPTTHRIQNGRCECCDIVEGADEDTLMVKYRQCKTNEIIA
ncbi:glycosyltransferase [Lithospermum erythrorhizon]|uniref:Glycosyltransferase n=1 Tax=Lithospermum erythrorhizon TaxID=34254 RepID=A0AAV3RAT2_LITER